MARTHERATTLAVSREEAQHASLLLLRARHAALVVIVLCAITEHCTGEKPLSVGARPRWDVPAAVSNAKPSAACEVTPRAPALAVSREEVQHSRLQH